jgi:hypothetical protein
MALNIRNVKCGEVKSTENLNSILGQNRIAVPKFEMLFNKVSKNFVLGLPIRVKIYKVTDQKYSLLLVKPSSLFFLIFFNHAYKKSYILLHQLVDFLKFEKVFYMHNLVSCVFLLFGFFSSLKLKVYERVLEKSGNEEYEKDVLVV